MAQCAALAASLVALAAASSGSDVSSSMGLSFPSSRLWAAPAPQSASTHSPFSADTSGVFAEYHANLAHAGLTYADATDNKIMQAREQHTIDSEVNTEQTHSDSTPEQLPQRLNGLIQENIPQHTGDHVLDRLAALHELVERKRELRHSHAGDLIPGGSDRSAFLQPSEKPVMGLTMPSAANEMNLGAPEPPKPVVSLTATHVDAIPRLEPLASFHESPSEVLDPAEIQDGTLHGPSAPAFSASPMARAATTSALVYGLRGASKLPPSGPSLSEGQQWPPSMATAPAQPSFSAPTPAVPHQMDPSFAAAIGAAAPELAGPMSMSFSLPPVGSSGTLSSPPAGSSGALSLPPVPTDIGVSPVQALINNAENVGSSVPGSLAQPTPAQMPPPPLGQSPNSGRLFDAPLPSNPAPPAAQMSPAPPAPAQMPPVAVPLPLSSPDSTLSSPVVAPAAIYQPPVPPLSSSPQAPVIQSAMPAAPVAVQAPVFQAPVPPAAVQAPVLQAPVPPLSAVGPSFSAPMPLGMSSGVGTVDPDLQRVNQTTAEDEQEIARIQARMAAGATGAQLWVPTAVQPNFPSQAARLPAMTAQQLQAPVANHVQHSPAAHTAAQHASVPKPAQSPVSTPVGKNPVTPVYDADGNRIYADNEKMLRDLKAEVGNFEQRVTTMEHQESSLLQSDDSEQ